MKKQRVMASAKKSGKKVVSPKRTTEDMLNVFEAKLAEAGVESKTDVGCSDHPDIPEGENIEASTEGYYDPDAIFDQSSDCQEDFGIVGCGPVMSGTECNGRCVEINGEDYHEKYEDVGGAFDSDGSIVTLAEIKEYWNNENMNDPILAEYPDFDSWFRNTRDNFLVEASCGVEGCDSVMSSVELDELELAILYDIAESYDTFSPVSGDWDTEIQREQKAIAEEFGVSMEEAMQIMIDYLGFPAETFGDDGIMFEGLE